MLAIHNYTSPNSFNLAVANAYAKLSKCQQFTTTNDCSPSVVKLQTLMQSYQNVSNSQLQRLLPYKCQCCKRLCKVIKMLAIHNKIMKKKLMQQVANAYAKLSKCQQFTTKSVVEFIKAQLQTLMQSYQNVSNSQLKALLSL